MTLNNKKMIIISSILGVTVILIVLLMLLGANLIIVKIPSISSLVGEYGLVKKSEKDLSAAQGTYYTTVSNLEKAESDYNKQKNKYNSISDETINVIKEATTEESYNLEYMWIKLGNYAKKNDSEIVMVVPGGSRLQIQIIIVVIVEVLQIIQIVILQQQLQQRLLRLLQIIVLIHLLILHQIHQLLHQVHLL